MVISHGFWSVYQRVNPPCWQAPWCFLFARSSWKWWPKRAGVDAADILDVDLCLMDSTPPCRIGPARAIHFLFGCCHTGKLPSGCDVFEDVSMRFSLSNTFFYFSMQLFIMCFACFDMGWGSFCVVTASIAQALGWFYPMSPEMVYQNPQESTHLSSPIA